MSRGTSQGMVDVATPLKALMCYTLIKSCIEPQLNACSDTCNTPQYQYYYAPNLTVLSTWTNVRAPGLYYKDADKKLYVSVLNNGAGYAWDIGVNVSYGTTKNQDRIVSGGGNLLDVKIAGLTFWGAAQAGHKTIGQSVKDFLIDESNFAKYLQGFKSDKEHEMIPAFWETEIPFEAKAGEFTKVIINVDSNKFIPETNENDNTYILEIDKLPDPATYKIENIKAERTGDNLGDYNLSFDLKNIGEENGEATVTFTEGNTQYPGSVTITRDLSAGESKHIVQSLHFDVEGGNDGCALTKQIIIKVVDGQNRSVSGSITFPLRAGLVSGRITDLFDKPVKGVTVTTSTGQSAVSGENGFYHLTGIPKLGKLTIATSHPDYSLVQTKEITMTLTEVPEPGGMFSCETTGLTHTVNFVMKDQDVIFTVSIKDSSGNPVNAHVIAANLDFRTEADIEGSGPLSELQPGKYTFTISAAGYKTISQEVNAVPNDQNLEFILEKLNGRTDDSSLSIITPQLLWEKDIGSEIFVDIRVTKDGKTVILYTSKNKPDTGKLYFLESSSGNQIATISTIANAGNSQASIDTSYNGQTTALCSNDDKTFGKNRGKNWLKLFNASGGSLGQMEYEGKISTGLCEVSPDGFYIYPYRLVNKGFYQYTRHDIMGIEKSESPMTYASYRGTFFTPQNYILAGCPEGGGLCLQTINKTAVYSYGQIGDSPVFSDSSQNGDKIATISTDKSYFFSGNQKLWEKDVQTRGNPLSISVSPGGNYVIYSTNTPTSHRTVKIFTGSNEDLTPAGVPKTTNEDVVHVSANDKGIFYAVMDKKKIKYFQVGKYTTGYNPDTISPTASPDWTDGISYYVNGEFHDAGLKAIYNLDLGIIYRADKSIRLNIPDLASNSGLGVLSIAKDSLFSIDNELHPVLLKGQMTVNFTSPAKVYAIKFDRYDLDLFQTKLDQFIAGSLPETEFFIVKNIHTKFKVRNNPNEIKVLVETGQVQILGKGFVKTVSANRQISIDAKNNIKESNYIAARIYLISAAILAVIIGILLFIYRKTKAGQKTLHILKTVAVWKWRMLKKIVIIIWKILKLLLQKLFLLIQKLFKKKK